MKKLKFYEMMPKIKHLLKVYGVLFTLTLFLSNCTKENSPNPLLQKWKPKTNSGVLRGTTDVSTEFANFRIHFTSETSYTLTKTDGTNSTGTWTQSGSVINLTPDGILTNVQVSGNNLKFEQLENDPKTGQNTLKFDLISE